MTDLHNKCDRIRLYRGLNLTLDSGFRHVTHRILQERNAEGQTLLAIIEVNRCEHIQHLSESDRCVLSPQSSLSRLMAQFVGEIYLIFMNINVFVQSQLGGSKQS